MSKRRFDDKEIARGKVITRKFICYAAYNGQQSYEDEYAPQSAVCTFKFHLIDDDRFYLKNMRLVAKRNAYVVGRIYELPTQLVKYEEQIRSERERQYEDLEFAKE